MILSLQFDDRNSTLTLYLSDIVQIILLFQVTQISFIALFEMNEEFRKCAASIELYWTASGKTLIAFLTIVTRVYLILNIHLLVDLFLLLFLFD